MAEHPGDVTQLLKALKRGDRAAEGKLLDVVYRELHRMAARLMRRERSDHTLQATALIHEAYVRLVDQRDKEWQNRSHFFGVAAQVMRRVLVDYARSRNTRKRGGEYRKVELESIPFTQQTSTELIALDEALTRLSDIDARQGRIVELRFFGGLTEEETAEVLGVSSRTVKREWTIAKAWLYAELQR
jgi:RNA polymerase sigma-70 factor (ECF subfamily)